MKKVLTKLAWIGLIVLAIFVAVVALGLFPLPLPAWLYYASRIVLVAFAIVAIVLIARRNKVPKVPRASKPIRAPRQRTQRGFGKFFKDNWKRLLAIVLIVLFLVLTILAAIYWPLFFFGTLIALWSTITWLIWMIRPSFLKTCLAILMILVILGGVYFIGAWFEARDNNTHFDKITTGELEVIGDANVSGNVNVSEDVNVGGDVNVSEDVNVGGDVNVSEDVNVGGDVNVSEDVNVGGDVNVSEDVNVGGDVNVSEDVNVGGDVNVSEDVNVGGDVNVSEDVNVGGDVNVSEDVSVGGDVNVSEDVNVGGDVNVSEDVSEEPEVSEPEKSEPEESEPVHTHKYNSKVVEPTCTDKGYTEYTCECGESYKDSYKDALGHDYEENVVEPTTDAEGYTEYTCKRCGHSYKDDFVDKIPAPKNPTINVSTDYMVKGDTVIVTITDADVSNVVIKYVDPNTGDWVNGGATLKEISDGQYRLIVDDELWVMSVDLTIGLDSDNNYHLVTLEPCFE